MRGCGATGVQSLISLAHILRIRASLRSTVLVTQPSRAAISSFEVALFRRVWAQRGGLPPFCGFGQNSGEEADHSPTAEEGASRADHAGCTPTVQVVPQARLPEAASPSIGSSLRDRLPHASGQDVSLPCCRRCSNRCEASRVQVSRFLGRRYWRRCDLLGQLRAQLLEMEAQQGTFVFDIDQTYCSQQGKLTENTIIRGEKTKHPRSARTSRRSTRGDRLTVS